MSDALTDTKVHAVQVKVRLASQPSVASTLLVPRELAQPPLTNAEVQAAMQYPSFLVQPELIPNDYKVKINITKIHGHLEIHWLRIYAFVGFQLSDRLKLRCSCRLFYEVEKLVNLNRHGHSHLIPMPLWTTYPNPNSRFKSLRSLVDHLNSIYKELPFKVWIKSTPAKLPIGTRVRLSIGVRLHLNPLGSFARIYGITKPAKKKETNWYTKLQANSVNAMNAMNTNEEEENEDDEDDDDDDDDDDEAEDDTTYDIQYDNGYIRHDVPWQMLDIKNDQRMEEEKKTCRLILLKEGTHRNKRRAIFIKCPLTISGEGRKKTFVTGQGFLIFGSQEDCQHVTLNDFTISNTKKDGIHENYGKHLLLIKVVFFFFFFSSFF